MSATQKDIEFGTFGWSITIQDRICVEDVLVHLMKGAAFHIETKSAYTLSLVSREIKDVLIKDNYVI